MNLLFLCFSLNKNILYLENKIYLLGKLIWYIFYGLDVNQIIKCEHWSRVNQFRIILL